MKTGIKYSKMLFLVVLLVAFVAGCGNDDNGAAPLSSAKAITAYSISGATGVINEAATPKTIAVNLPFGTVVTGLTASFTTTGASVKVGTTLQTSGTTTNNFASPVTYTVTAANGSTATYIVTVTVASSSAKAITSYVLSGVTGSITEGTNPKTIAVTVLYGTVITSLPATFTTTGASVMVGSTLQTSGTTTNDFTSPVTYTVTAADASTATYIVTVSEAALSANPAPVNLGTAGEFVILTTAGITNVPLSVITGNIGSSPITADAMSNVTCPEMNASLPLPSGLIYGVDAAYNPVGGDVTCFKGTAPDKTFVDGAILDMGTAYTDAGARAANVTELGAGDISGLTLTRGVYKWGTGVSINTDVTLNGSATDVWIFQIASDITQASGTTVHLTGGALAKNVFWQAFGVVALDTTAHMEGVIMAHTAITLATGATVNGRLLAGTETTLQMNTVTQPAP